MVNYEVTVFTTNWALAATNNNVFIKLVGTEGESNRSWLRGFKGTPALWSGEVAHFTVNCPKSLGGLFLIELDKQHFPFFADSWYPAKVEVKSPDGQKYCFPIHRWITDREVHCFREGKAVIAYEETHNLAKCAREQELIGRKKDYCWSMLKEGLPYCIQDKSPFTLPPEVRFSFTKGTEFLWTAITGGVEPFLKGLDKRDEPWTDIDAFDRVFSCRTTEISEYVREQWKNDAFFASQYLNGVNPIMIRCCKALPENFPVTDDKVFLHGQGSLKEETEKGNIFLCDYKNLNGVAPNTINGKKQYLMAPLVLLQKTEDKLLPIAIQLKQTPAEDNPIFYPTDSEYDWLMAKIFVRSADFQEHELNVHLLRTHLLAEVFAVSLLRNVPMMHPLYKLLVPHTRYTLQINILARLALISENGVFTKFAASGGEAMFEILKRSLSSITYKSLCIPEDIDDRGVKDIPNYYYKDDGLKLWDIIFKFVKKVLSYYYKTDQMVVKDRELQAWIRDIFEYGFLSQEQTGIPQKFSTVTELIKFVTMVIFTCSCQHSAVNSGQYDYGAWMPNTPITLQRPPPKKGASEDIMMQTLPDISTTVKGLSTLWLLSKESSDFVPVGQYPEQYFTEDFPCRQIKSFQHNLHMLSDEINYRNADLDVPYTYLDPARFENSVAI
ncbi:polyunsaturated fatty acid lipoxygenase ALOX15B-like [Paralichthys olivaceus]|uniref:polyunsaturated fatty acid lipoxygenase ALOX15B-like n=1 Tax=Paralichthys olivaceus TaxID=8255 RepID=UPI00097D84C1|nr:PREDICTED: arachidonate 15-lipoxygenase B-like [Paralichthys olivaceus]